LPRRVVGMYGWELAQLRECRNHIVKKCCAGYALPELSVQKTRNANRGAVRKMVT